MAPGPPDGRGENEPRPPGALIPQHAYGSAEVVEDTIRWSLPGATYTPRQLQVQHLNPTSCRRPVAFMANTEDRPTW